MPCGSAKAVSVGLAGCLPAFFTGIAFGSLRAGGFVFPFGSAKAVSVGLAGCLRAFLPVLLFLALWLSKSRQRWPCQLFACLFFFTGIAFGLLQAGFFPFGSAKSTQP